jgi:hypothetical protein
MGLQTRAHQVGRQTAPGGPAVTFQGPAGNLARPQYGFRQRADRQVGQRHDSPSRRADRRHRLRPLAHEQVQHPRSRREFPLDRLCPRRISQPRCVGDLRARAARAATCPPTSPFPTRAACRRTARTTGVPDFLPAAFQGTTMSSKSPVRHLGRRAFHFRGPRRRAIAAAKDERRHLEANPGDSKARRPHRQLRTRRAHAIERARRSPISTTEPAHILKMYGADDTHQS